MNIFNTNSISKTAFSLFALTLSAASLTTTQLVAAFGEENNETFPFESLPTEIQMHISTFLPKKVDADNLSLVSKKHYETFRSPHGLAVTKRVFKIENQDDFTHFINKYQNEDVLEFPIKLRGTWVTDETLGHLQNAAKVDIWDCNKITDEGLSNLQNATTVNLTSCNKITDKGLSNLQNATTVHLTGCNKITDKGLSNLQNATTVDLTGCNNITDEGLSNLQNATTVDLTFCNNITDEGLSNLQNATTVCLIACIQITDTAKQRLRNRGVKVLG